VIFVSRYDWGHHCEDQGHQARAFGELDPDSGWLAALERVKRFAPDQYAREGHPDYEKWGRLSKYGSHNIFLADAAYGSDMMKLMARSGILYSSVYYLVNEDADQTN
jgi:hypothetical protein